MIRATCRSVIDRGIGKTAVHFVGDFYRSEFMTWNDLHHSSS